jgi:hypothetical protein
MSNQILISSGAKLRDLDDVIIGTDGVLSSLGFNVANGVPKLDENGKILVSQLPNSVMEFKGVWNAATNTPTLADGTGNAGDVYLCNVAGTVNFGTGPITFAVGDYAVYTGTVWARSSGATGTVTSVAVSKDGDALAITGSPITTSGTINIGFAGTNLQYINGAGNLVTFPDLTVYVPTSRTLTINDVTYDLSANRTWTIDSMIYPEEGIAVSTGTAWGDSIVDNSSNWNTAYNNSIVSAEVTGTTTKTLTLDQQDGGTITASWTDYDTAPVTSVFGRTGAVVAVSGDYTTAQVTESGNLYFTDARARAAISLTTLGTSGAATYNNTTGVLNIPNYTTNLTGYVPYTGATTNVNLGVHSLSAYDLIINHTSGSGVAASITKGGAGEALTVVKSSGSGNAASITGGVTLLSELNLTTDLADAYIASAATWNAKQNAITLTTTGSSGASTFISNTLNVPNYTLAGLGGQPLSTNLTSLAALTYASTSFVKMTAAGTFALDTNTYALASALGNYLPLAGGTLTGPLGGTSANFSTGLSVGTILTVYGYSLSGDFGAGYSISAGFGASGAVARGINLGWNTTSDVAFIGAAHNGQSWKSISLQPIGGSLLVGTITDNGSKLQVNGVGTFSSSLGVGNIIPYSILSLPSGTGWNGGLSWNFSASGPASRKWWINTDQFEFGDFRICTEKTQGGGIISNASTLNERLYINSSGNMGIATTAVNVARLSVVGAITTFFTVDSNASSPTYGGSIFYRTTNAVENGNGIQFSLNDSLNSRAEYAYIGGLIETNTNGSHNGSIIFAPSSSGGRTERMRLNSSGALTVTSSISAASCSLSGTIASGGYSQSGDFGAGFTITGAVGIPGKGLNMGWNTTNDCGFIGTVHNGQAWKSLSLVPIAGELLVGTASGVSGGGKLQVNGNVNINGVFQINGTTIGGGGGSGVTGSGTTNYVTKWTGASTIGNSIIFDNGTSAGIGTAAPFSSARLQVKTTTNVNIGFQTGTFDANGIKLNAYNDAGSLNIPMELNATVLYFKTSETVKAMITNAGNLLVGTTTDNGYKLNLNGSASFAYGFLSIFRGSSGANDIFVGNDGSRIYIGGNTYVVGNVTATGGFFDTSDARLKTLVEDNYLLSSIANVKARLYIKDGRKELGYYAQDLEAILPSAVKEGSDGFLSLSYAQVHTAKIAVIEDEVTILKNRVSELETKLKKYDA